MPQELPPIATCGPCSHSLVNAPHREDELSSIQFHHSINLSSEIQENNSAADFTGINYLTKL